MTHNPRPKTGAAMRHCEECKIILEDDVRYCPNCGKGLGIVPAAATQSPEMRALLTSANLHRVRQEWDAAVADATAALELDPNNADVASILATIYEQRGNPDEAIIWYKIALELDPGNVANRARLRRVSLSIPGAARTRERLSRPLVIGLGAVLLSLLSLLSLVVILALRGHPTGPWRTIRPGEPSAKATGQIRSPSTGFTTTPGPAVRDTPLAPSSQEAVRGRSGGAAPGATSTRTAAEAAIKARVGDFESVRAGGARIDDVIADPRQGLAVVTFSLAASGPMNRARVIGAAGEIARGVFAANAEVKYVTARCVMSPGGTAGAQIAFVGDAARSAIDALGGKPTQAQIEGAFTSTWWNPAISQ